MEHLRICIYYVYIRIYIYLCYSAINQRLEILAFHFNLLTPLISSSVK